MIKCVSPIVLLCSSWKNCSFLQQVHHHDICTLLPFYTHFIISSSSISFLYHKTFFNQPPPPPPTHTHTHKIVVVVIVVACVSDSIYCILKCWYRLFFVRNKQTKKEGLFAFMSFMFKNRGQNSLEKPP